MSDTLCSVSPLKGSPEKNSEGEGEVFFFLGCPVLAVFQMFAPETIDGSFYSLFCAILSATLLRFEGKNARR